MPKTPEEMAASMIANFPAKTGKSLEEWIVVARSLSLDKHGQIVKQLKADHGIGHGYANLVAHYTLKPPEASDSQASLVDTQYAGAKADLKPIYDAITQAIEGFGDDVELAPKKAYVSLRRSKQFGLIQPSTKTRIDVGIKLPGEPAGPRLESSGSFNSMVTHRVRITEAREIDDELIGWLRAAYDRA